MPTLGPSILFAAGLALGVGTGVLIPRRSKPEVFTPPQPPSGEKRDISPIKTSGGGVVHLQGGFPGKSLTTKQSSPYEESKADWYRSYT